MNDIKIFTPDYEELVLPSMGLGHGIKKLFVRPMTMKDEKLLTNRTLAKSGKVHDKIFENCVGWGEDVEGNRIEKSSLDLSKLYAEDEFALFIFLRIISYGFDYDVEIRCPSCGTGQEITVNLEELPVKYADEGTSPFITVDLPRAKTRVKLRYPTKKDVEDNLENDTFSIIKKLVVEAEGVDPVALDMWLDNLIGLDSSVIRKALEKKPFGVEKTIKFVCENSDCPKSGVVQEVDLPITPEFFRI